MVGALISNALSAYIGDCFGSIFNSIISHSLCLIVAFIILFIPLSQTQACIAICLLGMSFYFNNVGSNTLVFDFSPNSHKNTYFALTSLVNAISMIAFPWLASVLWKNYTSFKNIIIVDMFFSFLVITFLYRIFKPWKNNYLTKVKLTQ